MKLEPFIILKLFLNFSDSEPLYSYKLYSYKKSSVYYIKYSEQLNMHIGTSQKSCKFIQPNRLTLIYNQPHFHLQ